MRLSRDWNKIKIKLESMANEIDDLDISSDLVSLLIAAEDHRYGMHPSVDPISICRAIWRSLFCGKREGGSTIAMQLVRVLSGRYERTIGRKIVEIYFALRLTKNFDKYKIPKLYLSVAYYGWRMNGLQQASKQLNIDISNISQFDAASIIARLKYPEPRGISTKRSHQIHERAKYILERTNRFFWK